MVQSYDFEAREKRRKHKPMDVEVATENLLLLKKVFDQNKIDFWLCFGTLLGAVREQSLIPYDTDIDICVFQKDMQKIIEMIPELEEMGLKLIRVNHEKNLISFMRKDEYIDIYIFGESRKNLVFKEWRMGNTFRIKYKYFRRFSKVEFLGEKFLVPDKYKQFLREFYGKDWRIPKKGLHAVANVNKRPSLVTSFILYKRRAIISRQDERRIKNLKRISFSRKITVFGAGSFGEAIISILNKYGIKVDFVFDNDANKWGREIRGITIKNPKQIDESTYVVIASTWSKEIAEQLEKAGLRKQKDYVIFK